MEVKPHSRNEAIKEFINILKDLRPEFIFNESIFSCHSIFTTLDILGLEDEIKNYLINQSLPLHKYNMPQILVNFGKYYNNKFLVV